MEYVQLFKILSSQQIRYMVCGGLAVNIYGIPRMTADIDLILDFEKENVSKFSTCVKTLSYVSGVPVELNLLSDSALRQAMLQEKNMVAYSFYNTKSNHMTLDVLLNVPLSFEEMWAAKEVRNLKDTNVNIVSIGHLIELKKFANRKQDQDDVILLSKLIQK